MKGEINHWLDFEIVGHTHRLQTSDEGFFKDRLKCFDQSGRKNCGIFGEGCPLNVHVQGVSH